MPSVSAKQHRLMAAVATDPAVAKRTKIPQSVGQEFMSADKGKKFTKSGDTMASKMNPGFMAMMKKKAPIKKMAMGGATSMGSVKTAAPSKDGIASKGKTKGKQITMKKSGGMC